MPDPTRRNEDEYFARADAELIARHRARLDAERAERASAGRLPLRCPRDGTVMVERPHHGVTVDDCPQCGGVFLDRGELELLEHVDDGGVGRFVGGLFGIKR